MSSRFAPCLLLPLAVAAGLACTPRADAPASGGSDGAGGGAPSGRPPTAGSSGSAGTGGNAGTGGTGGSPGSPGSTGGSGGGAGGAGSPSRPDAGAATGSDAARPADAATGDAHPGVGPTAPPPPPFRNPGIVVYWGQNGISRFVTDTTKHEKELFDTCRENPHYEMIVLAFIIDFFSAENADRTPRTNFSSHCNSKNAYDADHKRLYRCDEIGRGVNECQRLGKKVILSLGGAVGNYGFTDDNQARMFAQTTWDLFLGGKSSFRPFSTAVLDGIDLDIEGGSPAGYAAYATRLRELMDTDKSRKWYITAAPQCVFPDAFLGPSPGHALGQVPQLFDLLFVQFYNNVCAGINPDIMVQTYNRWAGVGPKIVVGLPATPQAGGGHVGRAALPGLLNRVKRTPAFGGVMLWDASYDQNSVEGGQSYGAFVKSQLP